MNKRLACLTTICLSLAPPTPQAETTTNTPPKDFARLEYTNKTLLIYPAGTNTPITHAPEDFRPSLARGFPPNGTRPIFAKAIALPAGPRQFISLRHAGLFYSDDAGHNFQPTENLPQRFTPADYNGAPLFRDIQDLWQNPQRPEHMLAINKHDLLQSQDGGRSFQRLNLRAIRKIRTKNTFTALAGRVDTKGELQEIWLGTSIRGIYRIPLKPKKKGAHEQITRGLPYLKHSGRAKFYEQITNLIVDTRRGIILASVFFQGAICVAALSDNKFRPHPVPELTADDVLESIQYQPESGTGRAFTNRGVYNFKIPAPKTPSKASALKPIFEKRQTLTDFFGLDGGRFFAALSPGDGAAFAWPDVHANTNKTSAKNIRTDVRAIYVSPTTARKKRKKLMSLFQKYNFNAAVIDIKDDFGRILYGSRLPEAKEMKNHRERAPLRRLVQTLKAKGIHTIARQVVFKDPVVYRYKNYKYAIQDRKTGKPWEGTPGERWVDAYSAWVQDYNIRIAREAVELGFDEIQFDYIRFPTDGPIWRGRWRFDPGDSYRSEAIESFLRRASEELTIPLGADLYGYNAIYREGSIIGQDVIDMGDYLDIISPMHYSSHFGKDYLGHLPRNRRVHELLRIGCLRPLRLGRGSFLVRPWLQAFKMHTSIWGWGETYMQNQILGTLNGGGQGFMWWGALTHFDFPGRVQKKILVKEGL